MTSTSDGDLHEFGHTSRLALFKLPIIFFVITVLLIAGTAALGIGPCGGLGLFFLLPWTLITVPATIITFIRSLLLLRREVKVASNF